MENVSTDVDDPNMVLETITSRQTYLNVKHPEKMLKVPHLISSQDLVSWSHQWSYTTITATSPEEHL